MPQVLESVSLQSKKGKSEARSLPSALLHFLPQVPGAAFPLEINCDWVPFWAKGGAVIHSGYCNVISCNGCFTSNIISHISGSCDHVHSSRHLQIWCLGHADFLTHKRHFFMLLQVVKGAASSLGSYQGTNPIQESSVYFLKVSNTLTLSFRISLHNFGRDGEHASIQTTALNPWYSLHIHVLL